MHVFQSIGQLQIGPGGWSVNLALPIKQNKIKKAVFFSQTQHMQHAQLTSKEKSANSAHFWVYFDLTWDHSGVKEKTSVAQAGGER